jgi:type I restriction enzyme S subunit
MPHVQHGIPIITAKNVDRSRIDFGSTNFTTEAAYAELSDKDRAIKGEILLTKDGSIGRAAIVETDKPFCINQSVALLRFGGMTAFVPYLLRLIEAPFTQQLIDDQAKGTAIRHISITAFAKFPAPLPPLTEQQEIVRRVEALFRLADAIEKRVASATARADKLTQAVLAKAFRGELVPTEAELARAEGRDYEPASALLERIQAERHSAARARHPGGGRGTAGPARGSARHRR